MALEDLRRAGILLPEEEWGEHRLETTAHKPALALVGGVAVGGAGLLYAGAGGPLSWLGAALYLLGLIGFTWLSLRAVEAQVGRAGRAAGAERPGPEDPAEG